MTNILVIEDEDPIRANILELLEAENFEGFGAENGLAGVKLARERQPDLILCDLMMPVIDGYSALTLLRAEPATASVPFIFLTALGDRTHLRTGMELGADDYLTKPCAPDELLRAIQTRLQKREAMQQRYMAEIKRASDKLNDLLYCDSLTLLGNQHKFYTAAFLSATPDDLALETDLRYALERDEFQMCYQPQVSLETGEIAGAEALLRYLCQQYQRRYQKHGHHSRCDRPRPPAKSQRDC